jgi:hypothetical protein
MPEHNSHGQAVVGPPPVQEAEPAPMALTVGEAILEAAESNSGVPAQRATDGSQAEPVCRADHVSPAPGRNGTAGEVQGDG